MTGSPSILLLGAVAGGLAAAATREMVVASPAVARWAGRAIEPFRRAGREGYAPTAAERRQLVLLGTAALLLTGVVLLGLRGAPFLAIAGPAAVVSAIRRRRAGYLRSVESGLGVLALAIADAVAGGRSLRGAVGDAADACEGPAATELARVRADLELGLPTGTALGGFARRVPSARVDTFCSALLSQRTSGGDLAGLMRTFASASADRERSLAEARSATAQARFTGALVAAMPVGAALFAELLEPGFLSAILAETASAIVLLLAALLQVAGFLAIARLSRVAEE